MYPKVPAFERSQRPPQYSLRTLLVAMTALSLLGLVLPELGRMMTSSHPRDVAVVLLMLGVIATAALAYGFSRCRALLSGMVLGYSLLMLAMFWVPRLGELRQIGDRLSERDPVPSMVDYPLLIGFYASIAWLAGAALGWTVAATREREG